MFNIVLEIYYVNEQVERETWFVSTEEQAKELCQKIIDKWGMEYSFNDWYLDLNGYELYLSYHEVYPAEFEDISNRIKDYQVN